MQYNIEKLREELKDYYGTAVYVMSSGNTAECPCAFAELISVDSLSDEQVIKVAKENGII